MVTSGFFNSIDHDRRYNAEQMSAIFDGIINDGVFMNIGTAFQVKADVGNEITVGIGRAWVDHAWVYNDAVLRMEMPATEMLYDRIDAVIIEVDHSVPVRAGSIKVIKGPVASGNPSRPELEHTFYKGQYPLAYILRPRNATDITQSQITNMVGTSEFPFVTGILKTMDIDQLVAQWWDQWDRWFKEAQGSYDQQYEDIKDRADQQFIDNQNKFDSQAATNQGTFDGLVKKNQLDFDKWFASIKYILDGDAAGNLLNKINQVEETTNAKIDILDARSQTKEISLNETGWYRIAVRQSDFPDEKDNIVIFLRTLRETHEVRLICADGDADFTSIYDKSDISYIRKIRFVQTESMPGTNALYLDIYFVNATPIQASVTIDTTYDLVGDETEWDFLEEPIFLSDNSIVLETYATKVLRESMYSDLRKFSTVAWPSEIGWYRIAMRPSDYYAVLYPADSFIIRIGRDFQNSGMEQHEIRVVGYDRSCAFETITEKAGVLLFDQLRIVNDGGFICLDAHYNANEQNITYVGFEPLYTGNSLAGDWFALNKIQKVSDTPSGTTLASYALGSDTSGDMRTLREGLKSVGDSILNYSNIPSNNITITTNYQELTRNTAKLISGAKYLCEFLGTVYVGGYQSIIVQFEVNNYFIGRAYCTPTANGLHAINAAFIWQCSYPTGSYNIRILHESDRGYTAYFPAYTSVSAIFYSISG